MRLLHNGKTLFSIYIGDKRVKQVYHGDKLIWDETLSRESMYMDPVIPLRTEVADVSMIINVLTGVPTYSGVELEIATVSSNVATSVSTGVHMHSGVALEIATVSSSIATSVSTADSVSSTAELTVPIAKLGISALVTQL